ncbi:MAG: pantoate--beta-alanine ligase [Rhizobacter sp.]|nr:pantoate--beta-alanine ligase [Chlorobiales bacterium]
MNTIDRIAEMQAAAKALRDAGKRVAFVPTMGALHAGHLSLIELAKANADAVVMSVFVNPAQFAAHEDLSKYPRPFERDVELAAGGGVDILFHPAAEEMYPQGFQSYVNLEPVSMHFEGAVRPLHFRGVATVVAKLFNIVKPHAAVFGQKDAQQLTLIRQMIKDLAFDVEIIAAPIVREPDGLAMSSRNIYLTPEARAEATVLSQSLGLGKKLIAKSEPSPQVIVSQVRAMIRTQPLAQPDYVAIVSADTFIVAEELRKGETYFLLLAVRFGTTRLIDNLLFTC